MVGLRSDAAEGRMSKLEDMLTGVRIDGVGVPLSIGVSHAFADFDDITDIDATIKRADAGMYRKKQLRKLQLSASFYPASEKNTVLA